MKKTILLLFMFTGCAFADMVSVSNIVTKATNAAPARIVETFTAKVIARTPEGIALKLLPTKAPGLGQTGVGYSIINQRPQTGAPSTQRVPDAGQEMLLTGAPLTFNVLIGSTVTFKAVRAKSGNKLEWSQ